MKKIMFAILFVAICVVFASCSFFTTSLGKGLARDSDEIFKNASTADIVDFAKESGSADGEVAAGILDELATRTDDIPALSVEDKEDILQLAVDATISMEALTDVLKDVDLENIDPNSLIDSVFDAIPEFDTAALEAIFNDTDSLANADTSVLATAAVVSLVQVVGSDGLKSIMENAGTIELDGDLDASVNSIAKAAGFENKPNVIEELKTTVSVVQLLSGETVNGVTRTSEDLASINILGILNLGDLGL